MQDMLQHSDSGFVAMLDVSSAHGRLSTEKSAIISPLDSMLLLN
jgi:hypothetical protein